MHLGLACKQHRLAVTNCCAAFVSCCCAVQVLPCCVSKDRPAAYPPTTAGEHLLSKYAATHAGYDVSHKQQRQQCGGEDEPQPAAGEARD